MQEERNPSLFLPKLVAILLVVVFLSGMTEIIFVATYTSKTQSSLIAKTTKLVKKPSHYTNTVAESSSIAMVAE